MAAGLEQRLLKRSIATIVAVAAVNVGAGLAFASEALVFDGLYGLLDTAMTGLALYVSRLIARGEDRRFQYGYWHLEPLLTALNAAILAGSCAYGALNGALGLFGPGSAMAAFGPAAGVAGVNGLLAVAMGLYMRRRSAGLQSELLRADVRSWFIGGALNLGLAAGFGAAAVLYRAMRPDLAGYADPLILLVLALALLPFPLRQFARSLREVLQLAPADLDEQVAAAARAVAERHGFRAHATYVLKSGRAQFIEVGLLAPPGFAPRSMEQLDAIRQEIAQTLGGLPPGRWLTIHFTADERWI